MTKRSTKIAFIKARNYKILVSKKEPYGTKNSLQYILGYNDDGAIRPLHIKLPQMIGYVKHFDNSKKCFWRLMIINCEKSILKYEMG